MVSTDKFNEGSLMSVARKFLAEVQPRYRTATLWILTNPEYVSVLMGPSATDQSLAEWRRDWSVQTKATFPVCRITVIGSDVSVQIRSENGNRISRFLGAEDPLLVRVGEDVYRIAYLAYSGGRRAQSYDPTDRTGYAVYLVRETRGDMGIDVGLWKSLTNHLGSANTWFTVRNDFWFYGGLGFPTVYPFARTDPPPEQQLFSMTAEGWCWADEGGLSCGFRGGGHETDQHFEKKALDSSK
jgi:hypothetical protein